MNERDSAPSGSLARRVIDQLVPAVPAGVEGLVEIGDTIAEVVDSRAPLGQESGDRTVGVHGLEEFDLGIAEGERHDSCAVRLLGGMRGDPEDVAVEAQGGFDVRDGDAHVGEAGWMGHGHVLHGTGLGREHVAAGET